MGPSAAAVGQVGPRAPQHDERPVEGEQLLIDPAAFLYKDHSVTFTTEKMDVATGVMGWKGLFMMRLLGPGRVGIESGSMAD